MTAEAIQRKALKSQKRKEKADEKREKDKVGLFTVIYNFLFLFH